MKDMSRSFKQMVADVSKICFYYTKRDFTDEFKQIGGDEDFVLMKIVRS